MPQSIADVLQQTGQIPQINAQALAPPGGQPSSASSSPTPSNDDTFSSLVTQAKQDSDELKKRGREISAQIEGNEKKIVDLKIPQPPQLTEAPKPKENNPFQAFGSAAGWIAVFGSMLTRAPLTSSLNAAAGAMNAVKENNKQAFEQNLETWKTQTENALKLHTFEMDAYKEGLEKLKAGDDSALTDLQVTAASFKNDTIQMLAAKAQSDAVIKQIEAQAKMAANAAKGADRAYQIGLAQQDIMNHPEWTPQQKAQRYATATNPSAMTADIKSTEKKEENAKKNEPTWDGKQIATAGQAIIDGVRPNVAVPGYGTHNPNRDAAMKWATDHAPPGWKMAGAQLDYLGRTQEERSESVIASKTKYATNSLDTALPLLEKATDAVNLGRFTDWNSFENFVSRHLSDHKYAQFNLALQTAITDYSALIARSGVPTDATRAAARDQLSPAMGRGGIHAVIDQMRKESQAQLSAATRTTGRYEGQNIPPAAIEKFKADKSPNRVKNFNAVFGNGAAEGIDDE